MGKTTIKTEALNSNMFKITTHNTFNDNITITEAGYYPLCVIGGYTGGASTAIQVDTWIATVGSVQTRVVRQNGSNGSWWLLWVRCNS